MTTIEITNDDDGGIIASDVSRDSEDPQWGTALVHWPDHDEPITASTDSWPIANAVGDELGIGSPDVVEHDGEYIFAIYMREVPLKPTVPQ